MKEKFLQAHTQQKEDQGECWFDDEWGRGPGDNTGKDEVLNTFLICLYYKDWPS